jgi:hypothetical protein
MTARWVRWTTSVLTVVAIVALYVFVLSRGHFV